jgi:hypothetical protein
MLCVCSHTHTDTHTDTQAHTHTDTQTHTQTHVTSHPPVINGKNVDDQSKSASILSCVCVCVRVCVCVCVCVKAASLKATSICSLNPKVLTCHSVRPPMRSLALLTGKPCKLICSQCTCTYTNTCTYYTDTYTYKNTHSCAHTQAAWLQCPCLEWFLCLVQPGL